MYKFLYYPTKLQKIIEITKHSMRKKHNKMARSNIPMVINLRQNKNDDSTAYG